MIAPIRLVGSASVTDPVGDAREYPVRLGRLLLARPLGGSHGWAHLGARILFVLVFLSSGLFGHLGPGRQMLIQIAAGRQIPAPAFLVPFSGLWIVLGSLSIALGIYGDVGALMVALFVLATALFMHPF